MTVKDAFASFMANDFEECCLETSQMAMGHIIVELFDDGTYRTGPSSSFGNRYDSPGMLLAVTYMDDDEDELSDDEDEDELSDDEDEDELSDDEDEDELSDDEDRPHYFDNAREEMEAKFKDAWEFSLQEQSRIAAQGF